MKYDINTLDDFDFKDKVVLARLDLNCPYDKEKDILADTTRIEAAIPTIKELSDSGAMLVILSHQGGDLEYHNFVSACYQREVVSRLVGKPVNFIDDVCGPAARSAISSLGKGEILMLDNVRYMAEEMTLFETKLRLSAAEQAKTIVVKKLAPLGDIYVCDAFAAAHRDQPTLIGFEEILPSAMGRLFEREYEVLSKIMTSAAHPVLFVLGGAKIEDAFNMLPKVLSEGIADEILSAGLLALLFMMVKGAKIGQPSEEIIYKKKLDAFIEPARQILDKYPGKVILPLDYAYVSGGSRIEIDTGSLPSPLPISDIGQKTINLYTDKIKKSKTVFANGPAGIFENNETEKGTKEIFESIATSDSFSVIGGGDSITALNKYGLKSGFSYVCTGGGAMVRFLSGEELPVVAALKRAAKKF